MAAFSAGYVASIASPVKEDHGLLSIFKCLIHSFIKLFRYHGPVAAAQLFSKIHHFNFRHFLPPGSLIEIDQLILSSLRLKIRLNGRCGRSQYHCRLIQPRSFNGSSPGMIFRSRLTLISPVMLFIYYYQSQIVKWSKQRRSRAYYYIHISIYNLLEFSIFFSFR